MNARESSECIFLTAPLSFSTRPHKYQDFATMHYAWYSKFVFPFYFHAGSSNAIKLMIVSPFSVPLFKLPYAPKDKQPVASLCIGVSFSFHLIPDNKLNLWLWLIELQGRNDSVAWMLSLVILESDLNSKNYVVKKLSLEWVIESMSQRR